MPQLSSIFPARRRAAQMRALLLATGAFGVFCCGFAQAQSLDGMRGELTEAEVTNQLFDSLLPKRRPTEDDVAKDRAAPQKQKVQPDPKGSMRTPIYVPSSPGGLTEAEERDRATTGQLPSIFDEADGTAEDDPFQSAAPIPTNRPKRPEKPDRTASERTGQTNQRSAAIGRRTDAQRDSERRRQTPAERDIATDELTTGTAKVGTVDSENEDDEIQNEKAERAEPIEGLDGVEDANPYEAVGVRAGSFILRPSVEQRLTATTNADSSVNGSDAILSETTLRLNAASDWSEHTASVDAFGTFKKSVSGQDLEETRGGVDGRLEYELGREYRLKSALSYTFEPESASSPDALTGVASQPNQHNLDGSLGLSKDIGKLRLGVTGKIEREWFGDAKLTDGSTLSLEDRNSTLASVALRTGYEVSPALRPFVEVETGRRFRDEKIDADGYQRSSNNYAVRGGLEFDRGEKLTGEVAAGFVRESFDDDRLASITGPSVNANLRWSPQRGTTVALTGTTSVDSTTTEGESGSLLYAGRLSLERQVRVNLTANATLGLDVRDYSGTSDNDLTYLAEVGATWWLNRYAGLTGRAKYETLRSDLPGRDYDAASVFLGLRLQR
ncbi:MAG: outer membrane beta-barrel protein [Rhizobiaceae bacterium]